jgi:signal transduction histidine kinase/FlaG/FlaF family flagellin (archaellin)
MNRLRNLNLRTKLIGSLIFFALIVGVVLWVSLRLAFGAITENALPKLDLMEQISDSVVSVHRETLEFVALEESETVEQFDQNIKKLAALSDQVETGLTSDPNEAVAFKHLAEVSRQVASLGQEIIQSHSQTLAHLKKLNELRDGATQVLDEGQATVNAEIAKNLQAEDLAELQQDSIPTQQYFGEFVTFIDLLQFEAVEFVASGEEEASIEFAEAEEQLKALQEKLQVILEADEPGEANLGNKLSEVSEGLITTGQAAFEAHTRTLSLLQKLEEVEVELDGAISTARTLVDNDINQGIAQSNRNTLIVSGVILILAVILGFLISNTIVKSVQQLVKTARQIGAGDFTVRAAIDTQDEIGDLANSFNQMTDQLQATFARVEEQHQQRVQELKISAALSHKVTTILTLEELKGVIDDIQATFDLYHAHFYLVESETGDLIMMEGSGEVGQQLKEKEHRLGVGQGIVGTVAATNRYFLSNNVNETPNFVRNPLLPKTNSELAVPLRRADQVLGVLDVQSEQIDRFSPEDVFLIQSIADQAAVAIENARLLTETQQALKQVERLNHRLTGESWQQFNQEITTSGYRFVGGTKAKINPDATSWLPHMKEAAAQKQLVKHTHPGNGDRSKAELAVPLILRGEVIGVLGVKREESPGWAEEEVAAVEAVANQVALALENARLSKEQEKTIVQLKDIDRLKSEFLTSMSHELRTPLNSIIGFADVLLQGIDGELNDMALNDIQLIHNSGKHLLALINDILDLAKIESGKMELVREAVNIKEITGAVLATSSSLVKDKPVQIIIDVPETLPPVYADKLRLNQILLNLVSNAAKFTHNGTITIKATLPDHKPDMMTISVIDTGIGIPANKLNTIFERFLQADAGTTRKYGGTGLGLAICRQLIELHGGSLNVRSREGVGSEFYFDIPLASVVIV